MLTLRTLAYNEKAGRDMTTEVGQIDFDPQKYTDKQEAAKAFHSALQQFARENGYNPDYVIMDPDYHDGQGPCVCWEEGPYQWGQYMTEHLHANGWYTEPFYSFDVTFTE